MDPDGRLRMPYGAPELRVAGNVRDVLRGSDPRIVGGAQEKAPSSSLLHPGGLDVPNDPTDPTGLKPEQRQFELQVGLPNPGELYISGQRASLRLTVDRKPLAWQWWRQCRRRLSRHHLED